MIRFKGFKIVNSGNIITKISNAEYNQIIKEIVERFKDLIYEGAEIKFKREFSKSFFEGIIWEDNIEIRYQMTMVSNDVKQMLNRIRRLKGR